MRWLASSPQRTPAWASQVCSCTTSASLMPKRWRTADTSNKPSQSASDTRDVGNDSS